MDQKVLDFYRQNIEFFGQEEIKELVYKDVPTMLYWKQLLTGCDVGLEDTSVQQIRRRLVEADTSKLKGNPSCVHIHHSVQL